MYHNMQLSYILLSSFAKKYLKENSIIRGIRTGERADGTHAKAVQ